MIYTIVDIETTGFSKDFDEILTFGFIRINSNMDILESGCLYFYKDNFNVEKYPAVLTHKLKRAEMVKHEGEFHDNIKKMFALCYEGTIIGKNSTKFDMPFIQRFIERHCPTIDLLNFSKTYDLQTHFGPTYKEMTGSTKVGKLHEYIEVLGLTESDIRRVYDSLPTKDGESVHFHGALYDCVATYLVLREHCRINNVRL